MNNNTAHSFILLNYCLKVRKKLFKIDYADKYERN